MSPLFALPLNSLVHVHWTSIVPLRRVPVPLVLRPMWMYWKDYETVMASQSACVDGEMGSVLKLYREVMKIGRAPYY